MALIPYLKRLLWGDTPPKKPESSIEARLTRAETDILDLYTDQKAIRDKVLRKIQNKPQEPTEAQQLNTASDKSINIKRIYGHGSSK